MNGWSAALQPSRNPSDCSMHLAPLHLYKVVGSPASRICDLCFVHLVTRQSRYYHALKAKMGCTSSKPSAAEDTGVAASKPVSKHSWSNKGECSRILS